MMLSVEIRVNGEMIVHVYGRRLCGSDDYSDEPCLYSYRLYRPSPGVVRDGTVLHTRSGGAEVLVRKILEDVNVESE